jgi:hypothetical protein
MVNLIKITSNLTTKTISTARDSETIGERYPLLHSSSRLNHSLAVAVSKALFKCPKAFHASVEWGCLASFVPSSLVLDSFKLGVDRDE